MAGVCVNPWIFLYVAFLSWGRAVGVGVWEWDRQPRRLATSLFPASSPRSTSPPSCFTCLVSRRVCFLAVSGQPNTQLCFADPGLGQDRV